MSGVCVGDELLKPSSCGQLPGHRMEGPRAACLMKEPPERQARKENPRGAGKGTGGSSRAVAPSVYGRAQVVHCACLHWLGPPNGTVHPETRESEAKAAGQRRVLGSISVVIVWGNMRQPRRRRCWTDRHAWDEGAQTERYPAEAVPGQTGGAGDKQTAAV